MPTDAHLLPSNQHDYKGLRRLTETELYIRRETTFLVMAGIFLGTLAMLNILGITLFITLWDTGKQLAGVDLAFTVAIGVLPYPITFLCTDFISEFYGRKRASRVVWVGFLLNIWVVLILWVGGALAGSALIDPQTGMPPLPSFDEQAGGYVDTGWTFFQVRHLAFAAVAASMIAYLCAQLVDVHVFHFWKKLTNGRHLWLRNNGSTLVSQLVDTFAVITITHFYARALPVDRDAPIWPQLMVFIVSGYAFKVLAALFDTIPFYIGSYHMARFLRLPMPSEHEATPAAMAVEAGVG
ncbi:MAG: queuosine precursor transporter [Phycisphaerales bacterium]|nr:queuosine precursor transporter [Phycisphaerales bacterium]